MAHSIFQMKCVALIIHLQRYSKNSITLQEKNRFRDVFMKLHHFKHIEIHIRHWGSIQHACFKIWCTLSFIYRDTPKILIIGLPFTVNCWNCFWNCVILFVIQHFFCTLLAVYKLYRSYTSLHKKIRIYFCRLTELKWNDLLGYAFPDWTKF